MAPGTAQALPGGAGMALGSGADRLAPDSTTLFPQPVRYDDVPLVLGRNGRRVADRTNVVPDAEADLDDA